MKDPGNKVDLRRTIGRGKSGYQSIVQGMVWQRRGKWGKMYSVLLK